MTIRPLAALLGLSILGPVILLAAARPQQQTPGGQQPQEPAPALTLHTESRIVLADLTVTDRHGNPVHGLTAQDFEVFDNNQQQRIASFQENDDAGAQVYTPSAASNGTVSNDFQHLPPVLNVLLIDTTNLELEDQMVLRLQLTKFLKTLPPNQPLAVFDRYGEYTVLLQPFTADQTLLQTALNRALPRIPLSGREYRSESDMLRQVGAYLAQIPGRKNVLWYSGGSTAYLMYGLSALSAASPLGPASMAASASGASSAPSAPFDTGGIGDDTAALHEVFGELETARIAIYPVDARGLTTDHNVAMGPQQSEMSEIAEATGGQAFFNTNGLAAAASRIVSTDSHSYTLTWSPKDFRADGKWHNIRITTMNRDFHLSYRRGYFADQAHPPVPKTIERTAAFAGDASPALAPDLSSPALVFQASLHRASNPAPTGFIALGRSAPLAKDNIAFSVDYSLSTSGLTPAKIDGKPRATLFFAIVAFDRDGNRVGRTIDRIRFPLNSDGRPGKLQIEQPIDLPRGFRPGGFLALAVWDPNSGQIGTLQVPVTLDKSR